LSLVNLALRRLLLLGRGGRYDGGDTLLDFRLWHHPLLPPSTTAKGEEQGQQCDYKDGHHHQEQVQTT
jgi:hypothetical protein